MNVHRVTEVKWNITVTFIVILDRIISSKFINCLKMKIMMAKVFIILQDRIPASVFQMKGNYFREKLRFIAKIHCKNPEK